MWVQPSVMMQKKDLSVLVHTEKLAAFVIILALAILRNIKKFQISFSFNNDAWTSTNLNQVEFTHRCQCQSSISCCFVFFPQILLSLFFFFSSFCQTIKSCHGELFFIVHLQEGHEDTNGGFGCRWKDDDSVQAQTWRDCDYDSHNRQVGHCEIAECCLSSHIVAGFLFDLTELCFTQQFLINFKIILWWLFFLRQVLMLRL